MELIIYQVRRTLLYSKHISLYEPGLCVYDLLDV